MDSLPQILSGGGYWILGIIVILEGLPIVGSFFPGHIAIISAGFLVKLGVLNLAAVLVVTIVATTVGDIFGFLLGRKYGDAFFQSYGKYIFMKAVHIEKAKSIIDKHTGKAIIFGKFSPITRPLIPFMVGSSGVHIRTFWLYNIIGGVLWVTISVLLGYVFGASYHAVADYFGRSMFVAVILTILIIWGYYFVNKKFHIFKKYELFVLGLNLVSLWALTKTIQDSFSANSFLTNFDISINLFMTEYVTTPLLQISSWISAIGGTKVMIILGLIIGLAFFVKGKYRRSAIMILSVFSTSTAIFLMKELFMRTRPLNALQPLVDSSFPSGHASIAAAFFVALAYIFAPRITSWVKRECFIVLCVLAVILIGLSRIVLTVHWASDVIAGWALGIFLATASILFVKYAGAFFIKYEK